MGMAFKPECVCHHNNYDKEDNENIERAEKDHGKPFDHTHHIHVIVQELHFLFYMSYICVF